jgi:hypothetical protein
MDLCKSILPFAQVEIFGFLTSANYTSVNKKIRSSTK